MKTIICKFHDDHTPSMRVYKNHDGLTGYCFVCKTYCKFDEKDPILLEVHPEQRRIPPTDIKTTMEYIDSLPIEMIRGLKLHYNDRGYYIQWPTKNYYKLRLWNGHTRYIAPSGIKPPLFVYPGSAKHLIIVEGEINAATLHNCVYGDFKVCSPGSASELLRHIKYYQSFNRITIIVDHDAPGVVFGCVLRDQLLQLKKKVNILTLTKDFNQILQDDGEEAVRETFEKGLWP